MYQQLKEAGGDCLCPFVTRLIADCWFEVGKDEVGSFQSSTTREQLEYSQLSQVSANGNV